MPIPQLYQYMTYEYRVIRCSLVYVKVCEVLRDPVAIGCGQPMVPMFWVPYDSPPNRWLRPIPFWISLSPIWVYGLSH